MKVAKCLPPPVLAAVRRTYRPIRKITPARPKENIVSKPLSLVTSPAHAMSSA